MNNIKLVIWDLDDTFWKGTLSEGNVDVVNENLTIIKTLVDRGIMNSISSKNDFNKVKKTLDDYGIFDLFIFPHINWSPKGEQVKEILNQCSLRAENTLFVDDNVSNREEVLFYNKGIMVSDSISLELVNSDVAFKGKNDLYHSRLSQYKILEEKIKEQSNYSNNLDFLRQSNITIQIKHDCLKHIDRLFELVSRSNQLNFTKKRPSLDDFKQSIKLFKSFYVVANDKYGNYGIIGFVQLGKSKDQKLNHFVFSCRVLGMNIESYIWQILGCPVVDIVGDVSSTLHHSAIDYISITKLKSQNNIKLKHQFSFGKILMIGGCDLEQTAHYLQNSSKVKIDCEFNQNIDGYDVRSSDLCSFINASELNNEDKEELCDNICCYDKTITFSSKIFSNNYNTIILSIVDDYIRGFYSHKKKHYQIGLFGYWKEDQEFWLRRCERKTVDYLNKNFEYIGRQAPEQFRTKLKYVLGRISRTTTVLLLNGCEIDVSENIGLDRINRNIIMNSVVDDVIGSFPNVKLIDMRKIVKSKKDLLQLDNRHYIREVYYRVAKEIYNNINGLKLNKYKNRHCIKRRIKMIIRKIKRKFDHYFSIKEKEIKKSLTSNMSFLLKTSIVHQKTFGPFKDFCKGKKIVVCGAGPSLNNYKPIKDAIHIAVNRAFLFDGVHFDFIYSQDFDGIKMVQDELIRYPNCIKFMGQICQRKEKEIPESFARECNALRFYLNDLIVGGYRNCHYIKDIDLEPIGGFPVVGMSVMQLAFYMNPTDIYLVGMDTSGGHFASPNQTDEEKALEEDNLSLFWKKEYELQVKKWKELLGFRDCFYPKTKIHSINPVGLKGIFDDIYQ